MIATCANSTPKLKPINAVVHSFLSFFLKEVFDKVFPIVWIGPYFFSQNILFFIVSGYCENEQQRQPVK